MYRTIKHNEKETVATDNFRRKEKEEKYYEFGSEIMIYIKGCLMSSQECNHNNNSR